MSSFNVLFLLFLNIFYSVMLPAVNREQILKQHYKCSNNAIIRAVSKIGYSQGAVIVLGAGPCSEIPLEFLCEHFAKVYLFDVNTSLCFEGAFCLSESNFKKVEIHQLDLSFGIDSYFIDHMNEVFTEIFSSKNFDKLNDEINSFRPFLENINNQLKEVVAPEMNVDMVISSLLLTQILAKTFFEQEEACGTQNFFAVVSSIIPRNLSLQEFTSFYNTVSRVLLRAVSKSHWLISKNLDPAVIYYADTIAEDEKNNIYEKALWQQTRGHFLESGTYHGEELSSWPYMFSNATNPAYVKAAIFTHVSLKKCQGCDNHGRKHQRCSKCKTAFYCSKDCQIKNWPYHKLNCVNN